MNEPTDTDAYSLSAILFYLQLFPYYLLNSQTSCFYRDISLVLIIIYCLIVSYINMYATLRAESHSIFLDKEDPRRPCSQGKCTLFKNFTCGDGPVWSNVTNFTWCRMQVFHLCLSLEFTIEMFLHFQFMY